MPIHSIPIEAHCLDKHIIFNQSIDASFSSHTDEVSGGLMRGNMWHTEIDLFKLIASHPISFMPSVPNCE